MKRSTVQASAIVMFVVLAATAQEKPPAPDLAKYYVGFLRRGPNWTAESNSETMKIQELHLAHIRKMAADGKLVLAGPFADNGDIRGILVLKVGTEEEAKALANADPAVKARRLTLELHPWWASKDLRTAPCEPAKPAAARK